MSRADDKLLMNAARAAAESIGRPQQVVRDPMTIINVTNNETSETQQYAAETFSALQLQRIADALFEIGQLLSERLPADEEPMTRTDLPMGGEDDNALD